MSKKRFEEEYWKHHTQALEERHKLALELIGKAESILDLGCGDGLFLKHVHAKRKVGLEMPEIAVKKAQKLGLNVRLFDFENEKLFFKDNEFEFVTMLDVLEHTFQPDLQLKNAARVGKRIVITVPNFACAVFRLQALLGTIPAILGERKGRCFYFTKKKLHEICKRAGVKIINEVYYFPLMKLFIIGKLSKIISRVLSDICNRICITG